MEKEYLESLGTTDDQLADAYAELLGGERPDLGADDEDGQRRRRRVFDAVESARHSSYKIEAPPVGSFAADDPETHAAMRTRRPDGDA